MKPQSEMLAPPAGDLPLPVLREARTPGVVAKSRSAGRRALALSAVQLLIGAHIAWWWWRGSAITPVEPSETIQTVERGVVNAGAVFFLSVIVLQLIFGRFVCGWGCHILALQDGCAWIMKKLGVRPKQLRSRVLVYAPLVLALSMFVWPVVARLWEGGGIVPSGGFTARFTTESLWETFPGVAVAVPFLLVCCGACVYLLGSKGFCTYGCPYGGVFSVIDRFSTGRIVVDHDACEACGHCTAVCTSNVRVHQEVADFGMVVDPGCMKCLDCVSVCPNDALRFKLAPPPVLKVRPRRSAAAAPRTRRVYEMPLGEECVLALLFLGAFLSLRGAYGVIPALFAIGLAACLTFLAWKAWRLARDRDVRLAAWQLKRAGRMKAAGGVLAAAVLLLLTATAWTGVVNYHRWRGDAVFQGMKLSKESLLTPAPGTMDEPSQTRARAALEHYQRTLPLGRGGIAWGFDDRTVLNSAYLHLALGEFSAAANDLRAVIDREGEQDELVDDLSRVMVLANDGAAAAVVQDGALARRPEFWMVRERRAARLIESGHAGDVLREADAALKVMPDSWRTRTARARTQMTAAWALSTLGRNDEAITRLDAAAKIAPADAAARWAHGMGLLMIAKQTEQALAELRESVRLDPGAPGHSEALRDLETRIAPRK